MKKAIFYHHLAEASEQSGKSLREVIRYARSLGIEWVEMDYAVLSEDVSAVNVLKEEGLSISSTYAFYDFENNPDGSVGFSQIDCAKKIGCDKIMIIPGFYTSDSREQIEKEREHMLKAMRKMCKYAATNGITPTIEDFDDVKSPIATAEQMLWFAERIPELKITFDTGNFMYSGQDELYAFELLKDRIVHVHCKDRSLEIKPGCEVKTTVDGKNMYPSAVGCGCIKMKKIIEHLKNCGYNGIYAIEHFGADNQLKYMEESAKFLEG